MALAALGADGGEQDEAVAVHALDLATGPELLYHLAVDLPDVHLPPYLRLVGWLAGWLVGWLAGWLVGW
jgi:hypothetical protein